jgi:acyl phosphate:glycerol-3-phosphate acyltransferase
MQWTDFIIVLTLSYLVGSIPFGLILVKVATGQDVRNVASGRTGGTNVLRSGGLWLGLFTMFLDIMKGVSTGWLSEAIAPGNDWIKVCAALVAIIGHNYSIYIIERGTNGRVRLRGGAGGATSFGGALSLWASSGYIIFPLAVLTYIIIGYASVTTMAIPILATLVFGYRAIIGVSPWAYVFYGIAAELIVLWALRPNIKRLVEGRERRVDFLGYLKKKGKKKDITQTNEDK